MPYATQQDMVDRFAQTELVQLTNPDNPAATTVNATVLGQALADADAAIDGYLQSRYTLPLAVVPKVILRYACDIARYFLYDDRATEQVEKRYNDAIKFLEQVAKGAITLGLSATGAQPAEAGGAQMESDTPVFQREDSKGFI